MKRTHRITAAFLAVLLAVSPMMTLSGRGAEIQPGAPEAGTSVMTETEMTEPENTQASEKEMAKPENTQTAGTEGIEPETPPATEPAAQETAAAIAAETEAPVQTEKELPGTDVPEGTEGKEPEARAETEAALEPKGTEPSGTDSQETEIPETMAPEIVETEMTAEPAMEPVREETEPPEPETKGTLFYEGYWNCTGADLGDGAGMQTTLEGEDLAEVRFLQMELYGDGSVLLLTADLEASGAWEETGSGLSLSLQTTEGLPLTMEAVSQDKEHLLLVNGLESFLLEWDGEGKIQRILPPIEISVGDEGKLQEITETDLGLDPGAFLVTAPSLEMDLGIPGTYELVYDVQDLAIGKGFLAVLPVTVLPGAETGLPEGKPETAETEALPAEETGMPGYGTPPEEPLTLGTEAAAEETEPLTEPATEATTELQSAVQTEGKEDQTETETVPESVTEAATGEEEKDLPETEAVTEETGPATEAATELHSMAQTERQTEPLTEPVTEEETKNFLKPEGETSALESGPQALEGSESKETDIETEGKPLYDDPVGSGSVETEKELESETETEAETEEVQKQPSIQIQVFDLETGETSPLVSDLTFQGTAFGIYRDEACTDLAEEVSTDEAGLARTGNLPAAGYYVKQTRAPEGYLVDPEPVFITKEELQAALETEDGILLLKRGLQIIRGDLLLATGPSGEAGMEGIRYELEYLPDPSVTFDVCGEENTIFTDAQGNAATEQKEKYPRGTLLYGRWKVSQPEQEGIKEPIRAFVVEITEDGSIYPYTVHNTVVEARIEIQMRDQETGGSLLNCGGTVQILDHKGKAVTMWDPAAGKYQDTFQAGKDGAIRLPNTLPYGTYTVKETEAPKGYLPMEPAVFQVKEERPDPLNPFEVVCAHQPMKGRMTLKVTDVETKQAITGGCRYELAVKEDIADPEGNIRTGTAADGTEQLLKAGTPVAVLTTDGTGTAFAEGLYAGTYAVKETEPAQYYALEETELLAVLAPDKKNQGMALSLAAESQKTAATIRKVDANNGLKPLAGITFQVFTSKGSDERAVEAYQEQLLKFQKDQEAALISFSESQEEAAKVFQEQQEAALAAYEQEGHSGSEILAFQGTQEKTALQAKAEAETAWEAFTAKQETTLGQYLSDLEEQYLSSGLGQEYQTDGDGKLRLENLSHGTTYHVKEAKTLPGYNIDPNIYEIQVDENGLINGKAEYDLSLSNVPNVVQFLILDEGGQGLSGAVFAVLDQTGEEIHRFTSSGKPYGMYGLASGNYTLKELSAPEGYAKAGPVAFTVTDQEEVQTVAVSSQKLRIRIQAADTASGQAVKGVTFLLREEDGKKAGEWTSDGEAHVVSVSSGTYLLSVKEVPNGYAVPETLEIQVTAETAMQEVKAKIPPITLSIHTKGEDGKELPGVVVSLLDTEGIVLETFTSGKGPRTIRYLKTGTYTLHTVSVPAGHTIPKDLPFAVTQTAAVQKAVLEFHKHQMELLSLDEKGNALSGASLAVLDPEKKEIDSWVSDGKPHLLTGLAPGTYTLAERKAPKGYAMEKEHTFTVRAEASGRMELSHTPIFLSIGRTDAASSAQLSSAELILSDADGKEVERFVTGSKAHAVLRLPAGEYTLTEAKAPEGYQKADPVTFLVTDQKEPQQIFVKSGKTRVEIRKQDQKGKTPLLGSVLKLLNEKGEEVKTWTTDGKPHILEGLPLGVYFLIEETAPEGYQRAESQSFTITDGKGGLMVESNSEKTRTEFSLLSADGKTMLSGAAFLLSDGNGKEVDKWTTKEEPHVLEGLLPGTYTLTQTKAPLGYVCAAPQTFPVTDERGTKNVSIQGALTRVSVGKKSADGRILPGAAFEILTKDGETKARFTTEKTAYEISGLPVGSYTLVETNAPEGYLTVGPQDLTVADSTEVQTIESVSQPITFTVHLKDADSEKALSGVEMMLTKNGKTLEKWNMDGKAHTLTKLPKGTYTLTVNTVPKGYTKPDPVKITVKNTEEDQEATLYAKQTEVSIRLLDEDGEILSGGELSIQDHSGKEVYAFSSSEDPERIKKLPRGTYYLSETSAPTGYVSAPPIKFKVTEEEKAIRVSMQNQPSMVEISKKDLTNNKPLKGAKLAVEDSKGKTAAEWTSGEDPYQIERLPVGDYVLVEKEAPKGYEKAEQLHFSVEDTEDLQSITMYNKPREGTTSLIGKKTGTMSLTSSLTGRFSGTTSFNGTKGTSEKEKMGGAVKTGDETNLFLYGSILFLSAALLGFLYYRKKKTRDN